MNIPQASNLCVFPTVVLYYDTVLCCQFKSFHHYNEKNNDNTMDLWHLRISVMLFTCAHFQHIAQISNLCDFHYVSEGIPSLMVFDYSRVQNKRTSWFMRIIARPKTNTSQELGVV